MNPLCFLHFNSGFRSTGCPFFYFCSFVKTITVIDALAPDVSRFYFRTPRVSVRCYFLSIYFCYNNPITLYAVMSKESAYLELCFRRRRPDSYLYAGFRQTNSVVTSRFRFRRRLRSSENLDEEDGAVRTSRIGPSLLRRVRKKRSDITDTRAHAYTRARETIAGQIYKLSREYRALWNEWVVGRSVGWSVGRRPYGVHIPFLGWQRSCGRVRVHSLRP